jgi:adenine-specific DNA-methyltransferase
MFIRYEKKLAKQELEKLVNAFKQNIKAYHSEDYLEANVRAEYINQFLIILGWDVNNENNNAPQYKEVDFEARTDVKGVVKHPDYAICLGGNPVYFVEAKPPSEKILNDSEHALQLRKYAYSAKKPLSILTNFDELSVYDTRKKPNDLDEADKARVKYITIDDYVNEFDYLWDTFSYDSVRQGSVDNYFDKTDGNYYVNDVDEEILDAIEEWRVLLVKSVKAKNGNITEQNINTAVQKLINRIVYVWRDKGY